VLLGIHTVKEADTKQMIMVYTDSFGSNFPNSEVLVEDYYINGVLQEGFSRATPFALEFGPGDFEVFLKATEENQEVTAVYMRHKDNAWYSGGLKGRGYQIRFQMTDSTGHVSLR